MVAIQTSLFAGAGPALAGHAVAGAVRAGVCFERIDLGAGAWVDVARDWLRGADDLLVDLIQDVDWAQRRRRMYDRVLDQPRLTRWYGAGADLPGRGLADFRAAVGERYGVEFGAVGLNYYRDGNDSVAWHADRELRHLDDTYVAIVTLGAPRPFLLRPQPGVDVPAAWRRRRSIDLRPADGDLIVMGGTCQARWEHCVPKVAGGAGPRISASIRWANGPE